MMLKYLHIVCLFFVSLGLRADNEVQSLLAGGRAGVILGNTRMYADSSFTKPTERNLLAGTLVEVVSGSRQMHLDDAQKQRFRWIKVLPFGQETSAWVFGDAVAIMQAMDAISAPLQPLQMTQSSFGSGFETATLWAASLEGRDAIHEQVYMNAPYRETYLVITNVVGRCITVNCGGISAMGESTIRAVNIADITGDTRPDLMLESSSVPNESGIEDRVLEVYTFQGGSMVKVLEDRLTLMQDAFTPSPSLFKYAEGGSGFVRLAYVDFVQNDSNRHERNLSYATYTYGWNEQSRKFKIIYPETHTAILGTMQEGLFMLNEPGIWKGTGGYLFPEESVEILRLFERFVTTSTGQTKAECFLYVRNNRGQEGYVLASKIILDSVEHAVLLSEYCEHPPLVKSAWRSADAFTRILKR